MIALTLLKIVDFSSSTIETCFINLITFADPAKTESQKEAVREWFDYVGAERKSLQEIRSILNVIKHW